MDDLREEIGVHEIGALIADAKQRGDNDAINKIINNLVEHGLLWDYVSVTQEAGIKATEEHLRLIAKKCTEKEQPEIAEVAEHMADVVREDNSG